jgi:hypothetical protein
MKEPNQMNGPGPYTSSLCHHPPALSMATMTPTHSDSSIVQKALSLSLSLSLSLLFLLCLFTDTTGTAAAAVAAVVFTDANGNTPWQQYNLSPASRTLYPIAILNSTGNVQLRNSNSSNGSTQLGALLSGSNAVVTYDFGQEVAGLLSITFGSQSSTANNSTSTSAGLPSFTCTTPQCEASAIGIAFSESSQYAGVKSDRSFSYLVDDGTLWVPILQNSVYTLPTQYIRGGFRYVTLSLSPSTGAASTAADIAGISTFFNAQPELNATSLREYTGYFYSSDPLLNRIWYAGAYTTQLCTIAANTATTHSLALHSSGLGWSSTGVIVPFNGSTPVLVDGAKRDRSAWAADYSISLYSSLVSQNYNNLLPLRNALEAYILLQNQAGFFPYGG